jgi:hypothetical protein
MATGRYARCGRRPRSGRSRRRRAPASRTSPQPTRQAAGSFSGGPGRRAGSAALDQGHPCTRRRTASLQKVRQEESRWRPAVVSSWASEGARQRARGRRERPSPATLSIASCWKDPPFRAFVQRQASERIEDLAGRPGIAERCGWLSMAEASTDSLTTTDPGSPSVDLDTDCSGDGNSIAVASFGGPF